MRAFTGPVHRPGDAGYDRERVTWNGRLDARPALVAEAASAADVRAAISVIDTCYARRKALREPWHDAWHRLFPEERRAANG